MLYQHARSALAATTLGWVVSCGGGGGDPGRGHPSFRPPGPSAPSLALTEVARVAGAVWLTAPPGDTSRRFIVARDGHVFILQNGLVRAAPFLDISARVAVTGEGGLLSLAFDPGFAVNGYLYLAYTDAANNIVVERWRASADPSLADPASRLTILTIAHPGFDNHDGGLLAFGPDGYLYLGTGDGGGAGDPQRNGQNPASLLGKLLRLDVAGATVAQPYAIPATNPFNGQAGKRPEIWALGLRNPWRYAFDGGLLYIADPGQQRREEIDVSAANVGGLNYGWNLMEGSLCYATASCSADGLVLPRYEYDHSAAGGKACAIIGGFAYRGSALAGLAGDYFFSDACAGFVKTLRTRADGSSGVTDWSTPDVGGVVSFGQDAAGELYLIAASGTIYRIDTAAGAP